jgi:hypothetical protein
MTTVNLDDRAAKALDVLRQQAAARGVALDRYLAQLAAEGERGAHSQIIQSPLDLSPAEFHQWLIDVSAGMPLVPPVPADFSRADLYDDHD